MSEETNNTAEATEPARRGRPKGSATKPPRVRRNLAAELAAMQTGISIACNLLRSAKGDSAAGPALIDAAIKLLEGNQP